MRVGVELMMTNISVAKSSLLPSKMMQGTWMVLRVVGAVLHVELERREAVLAVDDEVLAVGLVEVADVVERADGVEVERVGREEEHRARDGGLAHGGLVEVLDCRDLGLRHLALEGLVRRLDLGDEACDLVALVGLVARRSSRPRRRSD